MAGESPNPDSLYGTLYKKALEGESDGGGLLCFTVTIPGNISLVLRRGVRYLSGVLTATLRLANFMRTHLYTSSGSAEDRHGYSFEKRKA